MFFFGEFKQKSSGRQHKKYRETKNKSYLYQKSIEIENQNENKKYLSKGNSAEC